MRISTRTRRGLGIASIAALAIAAGCGGGKEETKAVEAPPKTVRAKLMTIANQAAAGIYTVTGTVRPMYNATLSSKVMGRIVAVGVREGDSVSEGQGLVSIDSRELQSAVNMAEANYRASVVGVGSAKTAAEMEDKTSQARISQAESLVSQAKAGLAAAEARRDLALAGPRTQEVAQAHIAVVQAESSLKLAQVEYDRAEKLVEAGALAKRELDVARNRLDLAMGQLEAAKQGEAIAKEGSRSQEIRAAEEGVLAAQAALRQAEAGLKQARAAQLQVAVRRKDVEVANAQTRQSSAALQAARVTLSYGSVVAPFSGRVVQRLVDPGSMAAPGVPLLIIEGGEYRLEAIVPEKLLGTIQKDGTAAITIDALPGKRFDGKVVEVVPQGDAASHSFVVKLQLGTPPGVKSGMFGKAQLKTTPSDRILIPAAASWIREGLNYVFAVNDEGIARLRVVTLGDAVGDQVEVLSGLNKGDRIVIGDRKGVEDGAKVEAN